MATTYTGGQQMPAYGTAAYSAAQSSPVSAPTSAAPSGGGTVFQGGQSMPAYGSSAYNALLGGTATPVAPVAAPMAPQTPIQAPTTAPTNPLATPAAPTAITGTNPQTAQATTPGIIPGTATGNTIGQLTPQAQADNNKWLQAHGLLKSGGVAATDNAGQASQAVTKATNSINQDSTAPSLLGSFMEVDSNFDSIFTEYDKFFSSQEQKTSLVDEYSKLSSSLGIESMNLELINAKKIIEGTEDDIRLEVQTAGGFATDSQVLSLANARNKSLVKNYNYLLESRDNAMTQLNTMMDLTIQDRQMASAEFDRKMNFAFKVEDYKQKAISDAREGYNSYMKVAGADSLLASLQGDQSAIARTEKIMGWSSGMLTQAAQVATQNRELETQKNDLDIRYKQAQINELNKKGGGFEAPKIQSINGVDQQWNSKTGKWENPSTGGGANTQSTLQLAQSQANVDSISSLLNDGSIRTAVGPTKIARFIGAGFDRATGTRQNFIGSVEQIRSNLNLETLIQAKQRGATFGALSDQELKVLSSAGSKIGTWAKKDSDGNVIAYSANEKDFKAELDKINNFAKLDYILKGGDPMDVSAQMMNDGSVWSLNSDGTYTQLR